MKHGRKTHTYKVPNRAGWRLHVVQTWNPDKIDRRRNPVLIVPGYGMNSFIFSFHPRGLSMQDYLAEQGFEVWRADLRTQGESESEGGDDRISLEDLAITDVGAVVEAVLAHTGSRASRVDVIGASLGGTLMFMHVAGNPRHRLGSLVAIGSPVRWVKVHPALRMAFASPALIGLLRMKGSRDLARVALPIVARHAPTVLSVYLNPAITDTGSAHEMVRTVEDPNPHINRQIAHWMRSRDLVVYGTNVSDALRRIEQPFLCVIALGDGIVPRETAMFAYDNIGSARRDLLEVGDESTHVAHADLFVSDIAQDKVFAPLAKWLTAHGGKSDTP